MPELFKSNIRKTSETGGSLLSGNGSISSAPYIFAPFSGEKETCSGNLWEGISGKIGVIRRKSDSIPGSREEGCGNLRENPEEVRPEIVRQPRLVPAVPKIPVPRKDAKHGTQRSGTTG